MRYKKALVLYNPNSTGPSERNAKRFTRRLERARVAMTVEMLPTEHNGHAHDLVADSAALGSPLLVVASSGDGGYNEVINGALKAKEAGKEVTTCLLPSGNANDHYKALHRPYVMRRIKNGQPKAIDILKLTATVNGKPWVHYAHSYIGFGLSSEISHALNQVDLNPINELLISAKEFIKYQPFTAKVDGKVQSFQSIIVSNVGKMSKILSLSKNSRVDDGLFEIFTVEPTKAKMLATLAKSAIVGVPHESQTRSYTFETILSLPVQMDGEVFTLDGNTKVRITILKQSLDCFV